MKITGYFDFSLFQPASASSNFNHNAFLRLYNINISAVTGFRHEAPFHLCDNICPAPGLLLGRKITSLGHASSDLKVLLFLIHKAVLAVSPSVTCYMWRAPIIAREYLSPNPRSQTVSSSEYHHNEVPYSVSSSFKSWAAKTSTSPVISSSFSDQLFFLCHFQLLADP